MLIPLSSNLVGSLCGAYQVPPLLRISNVGCTIPMIVRIAVHKVVKSDWVELRKRISATASQKCLDYQNAASICATEYYGVPIDITFHPKPASVEKKTIELITEYITAAILYRILHGTAKVLMGGLEFSSSRLASGKMEIEFDVTSPAILKEAYQHVYDVNVNNAKYGYDFLKVLRMDYFPHTLRVRNASTITG